jgi:predicted metal-dependent hydrolase
LEVFLHIVFSEHLTPSQIEGLKPSLSYGGITEENLEREIVIRVLKDKLEWITKTLKNFQDLGHLTWSEITESEVDKLRSNSSFVAEQKILPKTFTEKIPKEDKKKKRKLNLSQKQELQRTDIERFVKEYGRKAQKGKEPNDRGYSRDVQKKLKKHIKPLELNKLLNEDDLE